MAHAQLDYQVWHEARECDGDEYLEMLAEAAEFFADVDSKISAASAEFFGKVEAAGLAEDKQAEFDRLVAEDAHLEGAYEFEQNQDCDF